MIENICSFDIVFIAKKEAGPLVNDIHESNRLKVDEITCLGKEARHKTIQYRSFKVPAEVRSSNGTLWM